MIIFNSPMTVEKRNSNTQKRQKYIFIQTLVHNCDNIIEKHFISSRINSLVTRLLIQQSDK